MKKDKWFFRPTFYIVAILIFALVYTTLGYGDKWAAFLFPEDHFFENSQPIALMIACILTLYIFVQAYKNRQLLKIHWLKLLVYLGLAGLYFFVAGEEISWGQRIFHIATPASIAAVNVQNEITVHNLAVFEKNTFFTADRLVTIFWFSFGVLLPFGSLVWPRFKKFVSKYVPIPYWGVGVLFLVNYVFEHIAKVIYPAVYTFQTIPFPQALKQAKETNYDPLFILISIIFLWELNASLSTARQALPPAEMNLAPGSQIAK